MMAVPREHTTRHGLQQFITTTFLRTLEAVGADLSVFVVTVIRAGVLEVRWPAAHAAADGGAVNRGRRVDICAFTVHDAVANGLKRHEGEIKRSGFCKQQSALGDKEKKSHLQEGRHPRLLG